jgi:hypothetical protein
MFNFFPNRSHFTITSPTTSSFPLDSTSVHQQSNISDSSTSRNGPDNEIKFTLTVPKRGVKRVSWTVEFDDNKEEVNVNDNNNSDNNDNNNSK